MHLCLLARREPRLNERRLLHRARQQDLVRQERRPVVILLQKRREQRGIRLVLAALQEEMFPSDHLAAADEEDLYADAERRARHADGVLIARARHDVLLLRDLFHSGQLVAQARRDLEMVRRRRAFHAERQLALHILRAPLEKEQHGADEYRVVLP